MLFNLPVELTPFIGRNKELDELARLLSDPQCRLITLIGPGGSGKTRLAIEAAYKNASRYTDGICFVGLQSLSSGEFFVSALADALPYSPRGSDEQLQLLDFLRHKSMLLVLDNFEHLVSASDLLSQILTHARDIMLLVTSREVLNLREEWLFPVTGMSFPTDTAETDIERYEAVQFFVEYARRTQRDFSLKHDVKNVVRLCQILEGIPLALELAASWLKSLPCSAIVHEIELDVDFLNTPMRNLPVRHRSMRAVFEQSWKLLTDDEQWVFRGLSVFRGGFRREAAESVTGAQLPILSSLVDKSLLRIESSGRYYFHELLRQYAAEQLAHHPDGPQLVYARHVDYFANLLYRREIDLNTSHQHDAIAHLESELSNIRVAWQRAVDDFNVAAIRKGTYAYYLLSDVQGRYQEWRDAGGKAIERIQAVAPSEARDLSLALLHSCNGAIYIRLGDFERAQAELEIAVAIYRQLNANPPPGLGTDPLSNMGLLAVIVGDYARAIMLTEESLQRTAPDDLTNQTFALYVLANANFFQGQSEQALGHARRAYQISSSLGEKYLASYILISLGNIVQALEDYDQAREYYQKSYHIKETFSEQGGMAFALNCMARIAWLQADYAEAKRLFQQGHDLYQKVNDPGGLATSMLGLGDTALAQDDHTKAHADFCQALEIAVNIHWTPLILALLTAVSDLLQRQGNEEQAAELLSLVLNHPAAEPPTRARAQSLIRRLPRVTSQKTIDLTSMDNPELTAAAVLAQLRLPTVTMHVARKPVLPRQIQGLIEALSERELEILTHLAAGFTNQQIAEKLTVVLGTVKAHNHNIFRKLDVDNRVQAIVRARELNLI